MSGGTLVTWPNAVQASGDDIFTWNELRTLTLLLLLNYPKKKEKMLKTTQTTKETTRLRNQWIFLLLFFKIFETSVVASLPL